MTRFILLTLLNMMIPILLRVFYLAAIRFIAKRRGKDAPEWHFPWFKLFLIGLALAIFSVIISRLIVEPETFNSHQAGAIEHYTTTKE